MKFPVDLSLNDDAFIRFQIVDASSVNRNPIGEAIDIYLPQGIQKSDAMTYANNDFKKLGLAVEMGSRAWKDGNLERAKDQIQRIIGDVAGNPYRETAAKVVQVLTDTKSQSYITRQSLNPNTKVMFERVNIRTFNFSFNFIPNSKAEADTIREIIKMFRVNMYPEVSDEFSLFMKYPPQFEITAYPAGDKTETENHIKWLPAYLTSTQHNFNSTATTYHQDGAPVDSTLSLTFTENVTMSKKDVEEGF